MIETAVILAAGRGIRIENVLKDVPKGFIRIDGTTLIERSLGLLADAGIRRTVIVTGHLAEFYESLPPRFPGVETVKNPRYAESGSMYSFYCARPRIDGDVLLLESDLLYEPRALDILLAAEYEDAVLLSGRTHSGDEVYVETRDGRLANMSKNPGLLASIAGELVGISKISLELYRAMIREAESMFERSLHVEYEQALTAAAQTRPVQGLVVEDLVWTEIDDENHLKRARENVLPRLMKV